MSRSNFVRCVFGTLLLIAPWSVGAVATSVHPLKRLDTRQMLNAHPGAFVRNFDLSPDGRFIALLYGTADFNKKLPDRDFIFWVGVWEIDSGKLVKEVQAAGPAKYRNLFPNPQYSTLMRFSEGGEYLAAVVGSNLKVLGVPGLETYRTANAERGCAMRHVAFSQNGKVLAYTSSGDASPDQPVRVDVTDLQELRTSNWKFQFAPHSLSLSPDGKRILFSAFPLMQGPPDADVLLFDTYSGKLLKSFDVNYPGGHSWGAGWVQFLGPDRFMTSPSGSVNTANDLKRGTLKIWNIDTETLIQELSYGPYGMRGEFEAFATSPVVVAITSSEDPAKVGCDKDCGGFTKWLLFDISKSEPVYVSDALHSGKSAGPFDGEIRMSRNGKIVAVPMGEKVQLYGITF
jgi:WD40 repeat protein